MANECTPILSEGQIIGKYTVTMFIKDGEYNQTYRVSDNCGGARFMKFYNPDKLPKEVLTPEGKIIEIELCRDIDHPNVISYIDDGSITIDDKTYPYIITNYFSGRLLAETLGASHTIPVDRAIKYYRQLLDGLAYLHDKKLVHNDITPRNVMYDDATDAIQLIDMGHLAKSGSKDLTYITRDLTPLFRSPESFRNKSVPAGDIFSATAVLYAMITGHAPWEKDLTDVQEKDLKTVVHVARKGKLLFDNAPADTPQWLKDVISGGLSLKESERLTIDQIIKAIEKQESPFGTPPAADDIEIKPGKIGKIESKRQKTADDEHSHLDDEPTTTKKGNGFADVAGMDELKDLLQRKVLFILKNKEKAQRYKLTPPNGMLLYGPPGCGKSYFAEKFAEESGFNYKFIKASDLGSIYVHGGQGKIAELFDKARRKAPIIICFDEFDAMVPNRTSRGAEHISGEVNEFLSQLNNCAKDGIFVIGTTNQPEMIDPAVLRKGRVDISVYIPAPDAVTRKLMFDLYLKDRPCDTIDTELLAAMTENYVASDIAFIVNDAAMIAAFRDEPITQEGLIDSIKSTKPSLSDKLLKEYEASRNKIEHNSTSDSRPRVGFVQYQ